MNLPKYVEIGTGIINQIPSELEKRTITGKMFVVSDSNTGSLYAGHIREVLKSNGHETEYYELPPGELTKSMEYVQTLYDWLYSSRAERSDVLIAVGGGVIGDLVGFVAATYMRGIKWVQVATTLLSQVDSSIGGKVAVDLDSGKNMVGAFHPPSLSLLDIDTLTTLPERDLSSGWAEAIKHGTILDTSHFEELEANFNNPRDPTLLLSAVTQSVLIKSRVVERDPYDQGFRAVLNYGHTIAHALETATAYKKLLHGEAVSIGMAGAAAISKKLDLISAKVQMRQNNLLERALLPVTYIDIDPNIISDAMKGDKKVSKGRPKWVLLNGIGKATIGHDVDNQLVLGVLNELQENQV
tara:strand:+ start:123 stop:1187 length:1065 start_codon:yes stop_codon:yes gene_type:complete